MSEKIEYINKPEGEGEINDSEVIALIKEGGVDDKAAMELLMRWNDWWEKRVSTPRQNVKFNLTKAKLYRKAGLLEGAWETLGVAREEAGCLGEDSLRIEAEKIRDDMDEKGF